MTDKTPQEKSAADRAADRADDAYFAVTKACQEAEQRYREKAAQIEAEYTARIDKLNRRGKWIDAFFVAAMVAGLVCVVYITMKVT